MKTGLKKITIIVLVLLANIRIAYSQGFLNLDFEDPILPLTPVNFQVPIGNALPGWTGYVGGSQISEVVYNTRPLDAAEVTLQGTGSDSLTPIQGVFTVELFGASQFAPQQSAAIGQTGQIPPTANSLIFWGYIGLDHVSFGGQTLSLVQISSTAHYNIYGADISTFSGQVGELLFSAPPGYSDIIDNIQFSTQVVPEPSTLSLFALGGLLLGWRWRKSLRA